MASASVKGKLLQTGINYFVIAAQFKHLARAQIVGMNVGTLKILLNRQEL